MPTFRYDRPPDEFAVRREDRFPLSNSRLFVMQSSSPDLAAFVDDVRWPSPASDNWMHPHGCFLMAQDVRTGRMARSTDGTLRVTRRRYLPDGALYTDLVGFHGRLVLRVRDFIVPESDLWVRRVEVAASGHGPRRVRLIQFLAPRTGDKSGILRADRLPSGFLFHGCARAPFVALHCDRPLDAWLLAESAYSRAGVGDLPAGGGDLSMRGVVGAPADARSPRAGAGVPPAPGHHQPAERLELAAAVDLPLQPGTAVIHFALAFGEHARDVEAPGPLHSMYAATRRWWRGWLAGGVTVETPSPRINLLYRTSLMIARMCQASNGAVTYVGCGDYGACAWPRDAVWYAIGMDCAGHHEEAEKALEWCAALKRKEDGTFHANYLVDGNRPNWTQPEHDQLGEVLAGFWAHHIFTRKEGWLARHWPFLRRCADAVVGLVDDRGLVREDTSIWEDRLAQNTFTSGACAFGLWCAAQIAGTLGHPGLAASWDAAAHRTRQAVLAQAFDAGRGCLVENPGSRHADGAVLTLNSWFPILRGKARFERGLPAMVAALWHDGLGGLRRREMEDNTPRQDWDKFPWPGVTLWAVDACVEAGRRNDNGRWRGPRGRLKQAARCLRWVVDHAMPEGILAENVHPGGHSRFPMPSYSSVGFARTLIRLGGLVFDGRLRRRMPVILPGIGRVRLRNV